MKEDHATQEEVQRLREQIHYLKQHPHLLHKEAPLDSLLDSMERLQIAVDKLVTLFEQANKEIYEEYEKGLHQQAEQLKRLEEQNEKIARGIVAVADMLKKQSPMDIPRHNMLPSPAISTPKPFTTTPVVPFPPHDDHAPITPSLAQSLPPMPALPPLQPAAQPDKNNGRRTVIDKFSFQ